jgi:hypothetical protein
VRRTASICAAPSTLENMHAVRGEGQAAGRSADEQYSLHPGSHIGAVQLDPQITKAKGS